MAVLQWNAVVGRMLDRREEIERQAQRIADQVSTDSVTTGDDLAELLFILRMTGNEARRFLAPSGDLYDQSGAITRGRSDFANVDHVGMAIAGPEYIVSGDFMALSPLVQDVTSAIAAVTRKPRGGYDQDGRQAPDTYTAAELSSLGAPLAALLSAL